MSKELYFNFKINDLFCPICNNMVEGIHYSWIEYMQLNLDIDIIKFHSKCFELVGSSRFRKELSFANSCGHEGCYKCEQKYQYPYYIIGNLDNNEYNGYKYFCNKCFEKFIGKYWCYE